ncbi:centrosomal protein of 135 kDa [Drosophila serrata]|uniref:centrosomal protein of 135 kDa n=1 Tax=Drosophila serrata TaxID=7274 RepID=UPI000A1D09EE|nr:centrosomal protein of 135 kDa [Drosophila serrata]
MNFSDGDFKDLRSKLDVMGFTQTLPVLAIPLVQAIFADLIKTTECLRDTKKQIAVLLEDKTCWELGVEPYKCDNARLLAECNELHLQFLRDREDYELRLCESERKIRNLETDREHLQSHNVGLQHQLDALLAKQMISSTAAKRTQIGINRQTKKPFITTVRSGNVLPAVLASSSSAALKCTKCNAGVFQKTTTTGKDGGVTVTQTSGQEELDKMQNDLISAAEQLEFYKRKVESRNREIRRLNDMLAGGRPPAALAKDCCYKDVGALSQDIDLLQREKSELMLQVRDFQDKMHDAMQKALGSEEEKRKLQTQLEELKEAALQVEQQANTEIEAREQEIKQLQLELKNLQRSKNPRQAGGGGFAANQSEKHNLNERLNLLTRREEELEATNEKHKKKINKMNAKILDLQKELKDHNQHITGNLDEEKIRLASERDFFQKEYLRLMSKSGSDTEIAFLHAQIKSKDEELKALRLELFPGGSKLQFSPQKSVQYETLPPATATSSSSTRPSTANSNQSECVQAAIGRAERERDCARSELERVRCERDTLREKQLCNVQLHAEEVNALRMRNEELNDRLRQMERDKRELSSARIPAETNLVLLKEDLVLMRQRMAALQAEFDEQKKENSQISMLNEQNERIITELQSKLLVAERQRQSADVRASTLDSSRESNRNEVTQLRTDIGVLRQTYISLEHEKDTLLHQLDSKTERAYKLEYELKDCQEKRHSLEQRVKELEEQVR